MMKSEVTLKGDIDQKSEVMIKLWTSQKYEYDN